MNTTTPTAIVPPQSSVSEGSAKIAVAILTITEKASVAFCWTCAKALAAGLWRSSIQIVKSIPVYHENFAGAIFTIPSPQRSAALAAVKQTLAELDLLNDAEIAMDRAGDGWIAVHGLNTGGIKFEEKFLRPEYLDGTTAALLKWNADKIALYRALLEEAQRRAAAEGQNPESQ